MQSRRDFLTRTTTAAALGLSGTLGLSAMSRFDTAQAKPASVISGAARTPFGVAVRSDVLTTDAAYRAAIVANCQMIVPEGEMKWPDVQPMRGEFRFEKADAIVDFARQHQIDVRGHTLAWYGGMPPWTNDIKNRAEATRELVGYIEKIVSRYRGVVPSWDVVNEPLIDFPRDMTSLRPCVWTKHLGVDYIPIALRATAATDPTTQLVLNEYDVEFEGPRYAARRKSLLQLLRTLRDNDVPLHAVGLQAHLFADRAIDRDGLQSFLSEILALKLDVLVTELDVVDFELPGNIGERDALVAKKADQFLSAVYDVVRPKALLTWGLSDRYTWVPIYFKRPDGLLNRPLPFDADYKEKPLFTVIDKYRRRVA